ncbi:kinase-like domain-containing protein, partial [Mycena olivaceomarginata]
AVKSGGFADIYHGRYATGDGEEVEVALKVLRIFQDQSDDGRRVLLQKFTKEALVWRYLKHPNILPFLGVDGTAFPTPTMAIVSPWISQGSVLNYMAENSPASRYAIGLVCTPCCLIFHLESELADIIHGLDYLHSENIVHGDLCGRNILINERRAYLTDFGLAGFIELDTSVKTSTRSGSMRWMAPELILPSVYHLGLPFRRTRASDVWAFGCVCCEKSHLLVCHLRAPSSWPFSQLDADGVVPYNTKPCDKAGTPMPDRLWELVQWCFRHEATARPATSVLTDMLSKMKAAAPAVTDAHGISAASTSAPGGPEAAVQGRPAADTPPSPIVNGVDPTGSSVSTSAVYGKGKQCVRFEDQFSIVRFGPIYLDSEPEELVPSDR